MTTIAVVPGIESSRPKLVAPRWHTVLFIALFLGLTLSGALFQRQAQSQPGRLPQHPSHLVPLYLSLIAMSNEFSFDNGHFKEFHFLLRELAKLNPEDPRAELWKQV